MKSQASKLDNGFGSVPLPTRYAIDVVAGATATLSIVPIASAVDKAMAENTAGKEKLFTSFGKSLKEMIRHPIQYAKTPAFRWIWLVYGSSYITASATETTCKHFGKDPATPKWFATTAVNSGMSMAKDRAYARLFGAGIQPKTPMGSFAAWGIRDGLSIACFITLPPILGKELAKYTDNEKQGYYIAQMALPPLTQFVSTPLHVLGYDIYNRPISQSFKSRLAMVRKDYFKNVGIRMLRMVAPWSFGPILHQELRNSLLAKANSNE